MYRIIALVFTMVALIGCRVVRLTPDGREVMVVNGVNTLSTDCARLAAVVGQHKLGYDHALVIVRNKAAQLHADTVVINTVEGRMSPSRRINAMAFNCKDRRTQPIEIVNQPKAITPEQLEKAKKCQSKGGLWLNDQCVLEIE